ncbi:MAG: hypothetical protein ACKOCX_11970 [Planctomycetota bacterium]
MILIHEHYTSSDPVRAAELDRVRELNAVAGVFEEIVPVSDGGRRSFADLFALAARRFPGRVCAIANADIAFDESLHAAADLLRRTERPLLVALTRWDDASGPSMEGRVDPRRWRFYSQSQDTWLFVAGALPAFEAGFTLGIPACENRLAYEAFRAGIAVANPALSVRSWHHHASGTRSWKLTDAYRGPLYFPRLSTADLTEFEGYVLDRSGWRTRKAVVRC